MSGRLAGGVEVVVAWFNLRFEGRIVRRFDLSEILFLFSIWFTFLERWVEFCRERCSFRFFFGFLVYFGRKYLVVLLFLVLDIGL